MDGTTINANTFQVMVKLEDAETGNSRYLLIPGDVKYEYTEATEASVATFTITSNWLIDVYFGYSSIQEKGGEFLVVLKGDFIMSIGDECLPPKALDGDFIGGSLPWETVRRAVTSELVLCRAEAKQRPRRRVRRDDSMPIEVISRKKRSG